MLTLLGFCLALDKMLLFDQLFTCFSYRTTLLLQVLSPTKHNRYILTKTSPISKDTSKNQRHNMVVWVLSDLTFYREAYIYTSMYKYTQLCIGFRIITSTWLLGLILCFVKPFKHSGLNLTFSQEAAATALAQEVAKQQVRVDQRTKLLEYQYFDQLIKSRTKSYFYIDSSQKDCSHLLQKICVTESQNCCILPLHLLTPLMKVLKKNQYTKILVYPVHREKNQHIVMAPKTSCVIAKRSFFLEQQLSSLSNV